MCAPLSPEARAELYGKYVPMAMRLACRFASRFELPIREMQEVALDVWTDQVMEWDDPTKPGRCYNGKSSECTWAHWAIYYRLLTYCTKHRKRQVLHRSEPIPMGVHAPNRNRVQSLLAELGDDARAMVETLIHAPAEALEEAKQAAVRKRDLVGRARQRAMLSQYFTVGLGWPAPKVGQAMTEVEKAWA